MWSNSEIMRLALEALCLLLGTTVASLAARRKGIALGVFAGFLSGLCSLWFLMFAAQLRCFANWQ